MFKTFSKTKTIKTDQDRLIYLVERIVNITIVKTERANNESVKETLKDLESIFRKFLELRKNNPDKFDNLLWSKDFFDRYIKQDQKSKTVEIEDSKEIKTDEELKQEISFQLWFAPEEQLRGLTQFLNSFRRIWQSAVKSKNQEISRYSVNQIIYLLDELTKEKENQIFIEQNFGPHMEQKCATLPDCFGNVSS